MRDDLIAAIARVRADPGYLAIVARHPRRRGDRMELATAVAFVVVALLVIVMAFVRPEFPPILAAPFVLVFAMLGAAATKLALERRGAPMTGEAVAIADVVVNPGRYGPHPRVLLVRADGAMFELRNKTRAELAPGTAGVAHWAGDVLYTFTPLG